MSRRIFRNSSRTNNSSFKSIPVDLTMSNGRVHEFTGNQNNEGQNGETGGDKFGEPPGLKNKNTARFSKTRGRS